MKLRTLGIATLLILLVGLLWTLRHRDPSPSPLAPSIAAPSEHAGEATALASAPTTTTARETAAPDSTPEAPAPAPVAASSSFALVKVVVLNKVTRAAMQDIDVSATYDTGTSGHRIESTTRSRGKPFEMLHTDSNGRVEIEMPANVASSVWAYGRDHDAGSDHADIPPLRLGAVHELVLELPTGDDMPYWMKFVDEATHAPIAGVRVGYGTGTDTKTTSDAQGLVFLQSRTWAPGLLHVEADEYARAYLKPEPGHAQSSSAFVVTLPKCASVDVHVVDASGQPVVGAKVDLETEGYHQGVNGGTNSLDIISLEDPHWRGVTDSSGRAKIACIPPHVGIRAGITSPRKWSAPDKLVLDAGETRRLEWKLTQGCDVHGIVIDQKNEPVKQRSMWMRKAERKVPSYFQSYSGEETRTAKTDDQGRFHFDDVSAGTWSVGPSAPGYAEKVVEDDVAAIAQVVEVAEGQSDVDVTIRTDRGLFIRGIILDSKGEPSKGGNVNGYDKEHNLYLGTNLQSRENAFVLGPLMSGHYVLTGQGYGGDARSEPVEADAGASNVVLRLRQGFALSGKVVGPGGDPVAAQIWMRVKGPGAQGGQGVYSKNDGQFQFKGLEAGNYDLAAHTSDGATGIVEGVTVGGNDSPSTVEIHLVPGGHVRVRHEGPDRYVSISVVSQGVTFATDGLERGASRELAAPAGTVTVKAAYYETEKRVVERTVEVKVGQTVDVTFEQDAH